MHLTLELDETIRRCEKSAITAGVASVHRHNPAVGADSIEVAGGLVAFTGIDSPLSQAYGVGVAAAPSPGDVARITDFYELRHATPRVFVSPLAHASLGRLLAAAHYEPCEYQNVFASDDFEFGRYDDRVGVATDMPAWASASARGFIGTDSLNPGDDAIAMLLGTSSGVTTLQGCERGAIVATAAMDMRNGCSAFFAGSTLSQHRGQGWHLALLRDRIARARDAGARLMRATASPASASERNFHRCGFVTLYTRTLWERKDQSR